MIKYKVLKQYLKLSYKELQIIRFISRGVLKASFFDKDEIPVYKEDNNKIYHFSGERIKRGLYVTKNKVKINADVNGALNILCKSSVCGDDILSSLRCKGVSTPVRLQVI